MRLLAIVAQLSMFWIPMAVALLMIGYAIYLGNVGMGILGAVFGLVIGLYKVIMVGAAVEKKRPPK